MISVAALLAALSMLAGGATPARADSGGPGNAPPKPTKSASPAARTPSPSPTPSCGPDFNPDLCPSPTPSVVVVSPVAPDPTPAPSTPSYLVGTATSPTPSQDGTNTVSSPAPLGGGFVDQLPTPSQQATIGTTSDLVPHQGGLPLPFLAVGALLVLGAAASLLYAVAPRQKNVFAREGPGARPGVLLTPQGPEAPGSNLLSGGPPPRPGPRRPA